MTEGTSRLLKAIRLEPADRTPVWFMRQAGRYLPEYRRLRERHGISDICWTAELAAEATLQPIRRYPDLDAAIIFSDILMVTQPMGIRIEFVPSEGPAILNPVSSEADTAELKPVEPERDLRPVLDAIRIVKKELKVPLIGFGGAPFTLASYLVEGGPSGDYLKTKSMMRTSAWPKLMAKLSEAVLAHLRAQAAAGADAVQLFDSWVGTLDAEEYRRYVMPWSKLILDGLVVPTIHFGTRTGHLLRLMREAGGDAIGVDSTVPLDEAWERLGGGAIQGNLDPEAMLRARGDLIGRVDDVLDRAGGRPGHIFNLGHGILPQTPVDSVAAVIERVHERTRR